MDVHIDNHIRILKNVLRTKQGENEPNVKNAITFFC